jgi:hypothetical protein
MSAKIDLIFSGIETQYTSTENNVISHSVLHVIKHSEHVNNIGCYLINLIYNLSVCYEAASKQIPKNLFISPEFQKVINV